MVLDNRLKVIVISVIKVNICVTLQYTFLSLFKIDQYVDFEQSKVLQFIIQEYTWLGCR